MNAVLILLVVLLSSWYSYQGLLYFAVMSGVARVQNPLEIADKYRRLSRFNTLFLTIIQPGAFLIAKALVEEEDGDAIQRNHSN